jgi:hypothetical protein
LIGHAIESKSYTDPTYLLNFSRDMMRLLPRMSGRLEFLYMLFQHLGQ